VERDVAAADRVRRNRGGIFARPGDTLTFDGSMTVPVDEPLSVWQALGKKPKP
jgi:hypothetical protein